MNMTALETTNRGLGRLLALALIVAAFVIPQVADSAAVFGLGAASVKILSILSGVIALLLNRLPTAWKDAA